MNYRTSEFTPRWMVRDGDGDGDGGSELPAEASHINEKFHVRGEDGKFDLPASIQKAGAAYTELEARMRTKQDELRAEVRAELEAGYTPPEAPDGYTPMSEFPEGLGMPEHVTVEMMNADPVMVGMQHAAHAVGLSDEKFGQFREQMLAAVAGEREARIEAIKTDLGEGAQARLEGVYRALSAAVGDDAARELVSGADTVASIKALEHLVSGRSGSDNDLGGDVLTREDIERKMEDPRYWRDHDKSYHAEIQADFRRLAEREKRAS